MSSTSLVAAKRLVTRYCTTASAYLRGQPPPGNPPALADIPTRNIYITSLQEQEVALDFHRKRISSALKSLTDIHDEIGDETPIEDHIDKAITQIEEIEEQSLRVAQRLRNVTATQATPVAPATPVTPATTTPAVPMSALSTLPPVQLPRFTGKDYEWDSFWELFNSQIHTQAITDMQKYTYLLNTLHGDAKKSIARFLPTADNYPLAVAHLTQKYGNTQKVIRHLHTRLDNLTSSGNSTTSQRELYEELQALTSQLVVKNESLDHTWILDRLLGKFSEHVQRKVLRMKMDRTRSTPPQPWTLALLLSSLESTLSEEEAIQEELRISTTNGTSDSHHHSAKVPRGKEQQTAVQKQFHGKAHSRRQSPKPPQQRNTRPPRCSYCQNDDHFSTRCPTVSTLAARKQHIISSKLCFNCLGSHPTRDCPSLSRCFHCQKKHHSSICDSKHTDTSPRQGASSSSTSATSGGGAPSASFKKNTQKDINTVRQHLLTDECTMPQCLQVSPPSLDDSTVLHARRRTNKVILPMGKVHVVDQNAKSHTLSALLDTGSELSFINTETALQLRLPIKGSRTLKIHTFGNKEPNIKECTEVELQFKDSNGKIHQMNLLTHDLLTEALPVYSLDDTDRQFLTENRRLPPDHFSTDTVEPQILIGSDYLWNILLDNKKENTPLQLPSGLFLINTQLGHLVTGKLNHNTLRQETHEEESQCYTMATVRTLHSSTDVIPSEEDTERSNWERFWTLDSAGINEFNGPQSLEKKLTDDTVQEYFDNTVELRPDGYYVRFPWKEVDTSTLPDNRTIASSRLRSVHKMLQATPTLLEQYHATFKDQLEKGILEMVHDESITHGVVHYIAHQAVITPHKDTTKLRIVYDASAHYRDKQSLNDVIHQGPTILPDMFAMLLRFRIGKYALISDVEKAFLQVRLQEIDRDATRCLWVRDIHLPATGDNVICYRFTRIPFGINASPFLLGATIRHHFNTLKTEPSLVTDVTNGLFVDNLLITSPTEEECLHKYHRFKQVFNDINMNLREFLSNDDTVNTTIHDKDRAKNTSPKVLGIPWISSEDSLVTACHVQSKTTCSKRSVCQQIAEVYDPMGWLVPLLLPAKLFLQKLWMEKYDWDTPLSSDHAHEWNTLVAGMDGFKLLFPRCVVEQHEPVELITFSDASGSAMGTCTYLKTSTKIHLLMAKSKLTALKDRPTIPKMEMNATTMGARLSLFCYEALRDTLNIKQITLFSDSEITLKWLQSSPDRKLGGILVENRIKEIRRIEAHLRSQEIDVRFGYVNTKLNPADIATRGTSTEDFYQHFWWTGPSFITQDEDSWPKESSVFRLPDDNTGVDPIKLDNTLTSSTLAATITEPKTEESLVKWERFSTVTKAVRSTCHVLRFLAQLAKRVSPQLRTKIEKKLPRLDTLTLHGSITARDMEISRTLLLSTYQEANLDPTYLKGLKALNPRKDEDGIVRCYGRLGKSDLPVHARQPILIRPNTDLAVLISRDYHVNDSVHRPLASTIAAIRTHYWIPRIRQLVKRVITHCVPCQRLTKHPFSYPDMADLPGRRVTVSRPFAHVGLDYFGPLSLHDPHEPNKKAYGCILTCATTRLVHLDLIEDMSTDKFLHALRRFFARYGVPESITCDNAPTFLLGEEILFDATKNIEHDQHVSTFMSNKAIVWTHITPYSPWQGGFYERLIRSVKLALYSSIGRQTVTFDHLRTVLTEVEATLNSRPLTYQEANWEDQPILRPIDFIRRDFILAHPPIQVDETHLDPTYLPPDEARKLQTKHEAESALKSSYEFSERFWRIWTSHYLPALREQHKPRMDNKKGQLLTPSLDTIVLLCDPNQPRNSWRVGRISKLVPDSSGTVREVEVTTPQRRVLRRPVNQIVPFELRDVRESSNPDTSTQLLDDEEDTEQVDIQPDVMPDQPRPYNLRPRTRHNYAENTTTNTSSFGWTHLLTLVCLIGVQLTAATPFSSTSPHKSGHNHSSTSLVCTPGGIRVSTDYATSYEVCADNYCLQRSQFNVTESITFPAHVILHDHLVRVKLQTDDDFHVMSITCPPAPFCDHIDCVFCTSILLNPECWPLTAIGVATVVIYLFITGCYVFLYVPVVVGTPVRFTFNTLLAAFRLSFLCLLHVARSVARCCCTRRQTINGRRRARVSVFVLLQLIQVAWSCQLLDTFSHTRTICSTAENGTEHCHVDVSEVLKMNAFKQEACLRLHFNDTTLLELQLRLLTTRLHCEKESLFYTRDVQYKVLDSKRCPRTGSCKGDKCQEINGTSMVPELRQANLYPGTTHCVESCGGPGCDCFFLGSGCLFYRTYLVPGSNTLYEVFRCSQWSQEIDLEITLLRKDQPPRQAIITLEPNIPTVVDKISVTLSALSLPPTPMLNTRFISQGLNTAVWPTNVSPSLICSSRQKAATLQCDAHDHCICESAETKVHCTCDDVNVTTPFTSLSHRLPITTPGVSLHHSHDNDTVIATLQERVMLEFIAHIDEHIDTTSLHVTEDQCTMDDTIMTGCYNCAKGAQATVVCMSKHSYTTVAEITCDHHSYTVPCSTQGISSPLTFYTDNAQHFLQCSVRCGSAEHSFSITGSLKYTSNVEEAFSKWIHGESNSFSEIAWPDITHILDVYASWYKHVALAMIGLALALLVTYKYMTTCSFKGLQCILWTLTRIILCAYHLLCGTLRLLRLQFFRAARNTVPSKPSEKQL